MNSVILSNGLFPPIAFAPGFLSFLGLSVCLSVIVTINSFFPITYSNLCFLVQFSIAPCSGFLSLLTVRTTRLTTWSIFQFGIVIFYFQFLNQLVFNHLEPPNLLQVFVPFSALSQAYIQASHQFSSNQGLSMNLWIHFSFDTWMMPRICARICSNLHF